MHLEVIVELFLDGGFEVGDPAAEAPDAGFSLLFHIGSLYVE